MIPLWGKYTSSTGVCNGNKFKILVEFLYDCSSLHCDIAVCVSTPIKSTSYSIFTIFYIVFPSVFISIALSDIFGCFLTDTKIIKLRTIHEKTINPQFVFPLTVGGIESEGTGAICFKLNFAVL